MFKRWPERCQVLLSVTGCSAVPVSHQIQKPHTKHCCFTLDMNQTPEKSRQNAPFSSSRAAFCLFTSSCQNSEHRSDPLGPPHKATARNRKVTVHPVLCVQLQDTPAICLLQACRRDCPVKDLPQHLLTPHSPHLMGNHCECRP